MAARAVVKRTVIEAARRAAIPAPIIAQLIDVLGEQMRFVSDVHRGDTFRVLYEPPATAPRTAGRLIAVEYFGRTRSIAIYRYGEEDGEPLYVDGAGQRLNGAPLDYPVEFTHISSPFSPSRFHPILQENRPHLGVDFAAPAGTPVRAIGAGVVRWASAKGGFGNHVEIDHGEEVVSAYSHLQRIHSAVRPGARVTRGQLLGWVGQTGLATGPHLHFAIFERGEYVDPLTVAPPALAAIDPAEFAAFRQRIRTRLRQLVASGPTAAPSAPEIGLPLAKNTAVAAIHLTF